MIRKGFLFDPDLCTGCSACRLACQIENATPPPRAWRRVVPFNETAHPRAGRSHLSIACCHCENPACVDACPSRACAKDPATGIVAIDDATCLGCRYCSWVCPYDAPRFAPERGVMEKCDLCARRRAAGEGPACAAACPTGALGFGAVEAADPEGDAPGIPAPGFPARGLAPAVRIEPRLRTAEPPVGPADVLPEPEGALVATAREPVAGKILLKSEWTLVLFTFAVPVLVGLFAAGALGGPAVALLPFLAAGVILPGLTALHLGRVKAAAHAGRNIESSFLSREIVFYSLFLVLAATSLSLAPVPRGLDAAALVAGTAALVAIDGVYRRLPLGGGERTGIGNRAGSASALLSGICFTALFLPSYPVFGVVLILKGVLFFLGRPWLSLGLRWRGGWRGTRIGPAAGALVAVRVGAGLLLAPGLLLADAGAFHAQAVAATLAGELADRCLFYRGLDIVTPEGEMAAALDRDLSGR